MVEIMNISCVFLFVCSENADLLVVFRSRLHYKCTAVLRASAIVISSDPVRKPLL